MSERYSYDTTRHYPAGTADGAVASLVLGILSLVACGIFTGIPAMVYGRKATTRVDESGGRLDGRGLATAGFVMGLISTVLTGLALVLVIGILALGGGTTDTTYDDCDSFSDTTC